MTARHASPVRLRPRIAAAFVVAALLPVAAATLTVARFSPASAATTGSDPVAVTKTKSVSRIYVNQDGSDKVVDKRKVTVSVSDTKQLRSLQQITVNWSGAHETDGEELDLNSDLAQNEEYSFDLFECRGLDSTSVPVKDRISPETCWTQFPDERYQQTPPNPAAWQSDYYAPPASRAGIVGAPSPLPAACSSLLFGVNTQRWVPFDNANGTVDSGGPRGCAGLAPEAAPANRSSLSLPSNETFGVTQPNGKGTASFDVFTDEDHASLGCSSKVPCSLVAVPIEGISCDPYGTTLDASQQPDPDQAAQAKTDCETNGSFKPGELLSNVEQSGAPAVDGTLWWSASNWRNRISFPLTFAQADDVCSLTSGSASLPMYGSEMMAQAATQWSPHFCLNSKLFNPSLVQASEPESRTLLSQNEESKTLSSSGVEAVIDAEPPTLPYPKRTVRAPVAVSGFGIAFDVDNAKTNKPVVTLNLDARLLAKLLTESYPAVPVVQQTYPLNHGLPTLTNNPENITTDPEFKLLNPDVGTSTALAAAALLTVNVQSDVMTALTTYINDDPAARAWLNGEPDPWGMTVNPNYRGIQLPVSRWPLLDSYEPLTYYNSGNNVCLQNDPVPYLPLIQDPQANFYQIALDADFSIAQDQTTCSLPPEYQQGQTAGLKLVASGRQAPGFRFMLSVVSLADAARYSLHVASLETYPTMSDSQALTGASGLTFVAPTTKSMQAAAALAQPDTTTGGYTIPSASLRTATNAGAYPGTMLLSADVPTTGLPSAVAGRYANYLRYAAGPGQVQGSLPGQLPAGYLPLTAANGLGALASYTSRAADAVAAQKSGTPSFTAPPTPSPTPTTTTTNSGGPSPTTVATTPSIGNVSSPPVSASTSPAPAQSPSVASSSPSVVSLGKTDLLSAGVTGKILPAALILMLVCAAAVVGLQIMARRR